MVSEGAEGRRGRRGRGRDRRTFIVLFENLSSSLDVGCLELLEVEESEVELEEGVEGGSRLARL